MSDDTAISAESMADMFREQKDLFDAFFAAINYDEVYELASLASPRLRCATPNAYRVRLYPVLRGSCSPAAASSSSPAWENLDSSPKRCQNEGAQQPVRLPTCPPAPRRFRKRW